MPVQTTNMLIDFLYEDCSHQRAAIRQPGVVHAAGACRCFNSCSLIEDLVVQGEAAMAFELFFLANSFPSHGSQCNIFLGLQKDLNLHCILLGGLFVEMPLYLFLEVKEKLPDLYGRGFLQKKNVLFLFPRNYHSSIQIL